MSSIAAQELELLSFFAVEPELAAGEQGWPYNGFLYRVKSGAYAVSFSIWPACQDIDLEISHLGHPIYSLRAQSIVDVRYHQDGGVETLELIVSDRDRIWLRLSPSLLVTQDLAGA